MDLLNPSDKVLLVHNTYTSEEEIMRATDSCYWCFCPKANLYIENRLPNIPLFLSHTNKIVLGTDSLASNDDLNLIAEIKTIQEICH